jgi:hypothetical protein
MAKCDPVIEKIFRLEFEFVAEVPERGSLVHETADLIEAWIGWFQKPAGD